MLSIQLFGTFETRYQDRRLPEPKRRSTARVLAFLAWHAGRPLPRRQVAESLWPDMPTEDALAELRRNLYGLTTFLAQATGRGGWLAATRRSVALLAADDLRCDAQAFVALCRRGLAPGQGPAAEAEAAAALEAAVALHAADLLDDWDDEWLEGPRRQAREHLGEALSALVRHHEGRGAPRQALGHARRLVALDPLHEAAHRSLMRLHAQSGDRAAALAQFEALRVALRDELDIDPSEATLKLHQAIRSDAFGALGAAQPAAPPAARGLGVLSPPDDAPRNGATSQRPHYFGPFVGRTAELGTLERLLPGARVVSLVGPGGVGKTRLAVALIEQLERAPEPRFAGIAWRDLAEPDGPAGDVTALLPAFEPLDDRPSLLVLDTCDGHLDVLAPAIEALVARHALLCVLATCRSRLAIACETVMALDPLLTARDGDPADDAVRLFIARARDATPAWSPSDADLDRIAAICEALDGLPLAIEHAAAQRARLSLAELLDVVQHDPSALAPGVRTGPPRQRSLAASFGFSYERLAPADQRALRCLAVLAGPFSRPMAARMLEQALGERDDVAAATETLLRLVDASLVALDRRPDHDHTPYRLPRTIAAFAWAAAVRLGEARALADHHAAEVVSLAEREAAALATPEHAAGERRLTSLAPDVMRAIAHIGATADAGLGIRLAAALMRYWYRRGVPQGVEAWLDVLLASPDLAAAAPRRLTALATCAAGVCAHARGDARKAIARFAAAEELLDALGEPRALAETRTYAAVAMARLGDLAGAKARCLAALEALRSDAWPVDVAVVRSVLAELAWRAGDVGGAEALFAQALVVLRSARWHALALGNVLRGLGAIAVQRRRFDDAAAYFAEGLSLFQGLDHQAAAAVWHNELGCLEFARGRMSAARARFQEALRTHQACGNLAGAAIQMHNLGEVALIEGDAPLARLLFARSLETDPGATTSARGIRTLCFLAEAHIHLDQPYRARRQLDACLPLAEASHDAALLAHANGVLGLIELLGGEAGAAAGALASSLAGWRAADEDRRGLRFADLAVCLLAQQGARPAADALDTILAPLRDTAPRTSPLESRLIEEARGTIGRERVVAEPSVAYAAGGVGDALAAAERAMRAHATTGFASG